MKKPADQHSSKARSQTKTFRAMKANPCVSISLLFGCILIAFTAQTFSADACGGNVNTSTNLLGGNMTNAAAPIMPSPNDSGGLVQVSKIGLQVAIPGDGTPTGQLFNGTGGFNGDLFIFASEDGTISGWRPALGTAAETLTNRGTAVYKGITLIMTSNGPVLLAANFREGTLAAYGTNASGVALVAQFSDPNAPAGYAPFNVRSLAGVVFVTFAKQNDAKHDDVAGRGHGLIDTFDPQTGAFRRFATGSDASGRDRKS